MKRSFILILVLLIVSFTHAQLGAFDSNEQPSAPDYSLEKNWSALPFRQDAADVIPETETWVNDSLKPVDVFFIYPTLYMSGKTWNANLSNKKLNKRLDTKPVRYQASVFNASARVYAPRYRQSIIKAFYDHENGEKSLAFAYEDVKKAFQYYLDHYNNGRPFIIASHSQGSHHARRLLREMIDTTSLRNRMVAAYVIGYGMDKDNYKNLKPCEDAKQTGCYITWASFKHGYTQEEKWLVGNICVNPLSWKCDTIAVDASKSMGAILLNFNKRYDNAVSTEIHNNYLWVKNDLPLIRTWGNLHIADYNLFWYDIRKNVKERIDAYIKK
jgi:hypothetical protein